MRRGEAIFGSVVGSRGLASIQSPLSSNLRLVVTDHPRPPPHPNPTPQASAFLSVKLSSYYSCCREPGRVERAQTCRLSEQGNAWHPSPDVEQVKRKGIWVGGGGGLQLRKASCRGWLKVSLKEYISLGWKM